MNLSDFKKLGDAETRANALRWMKQYTFSPLQSSIKWILCVIAAWLVGYVPFVAEASAAGTLGYESLWMLRILVLAAGLWLTEAIPSYATAMLVMGLELLFISTATDPDKVWAWKEILEVWGSPLIWLFFGGFLIAEAFRSAGLDRITAKLILARTGKGTVSITVGLMMVTYILSMFMSNTATTTVVIAVIAPLLAQASKDSLSVRGLLLALAMGASLGGMATIVGTPPNAIAVANLAQQGISVDFIYWMKLAGPPSIILLTISFLYIWLFYLRRDKQPMDFDIESLTKLTKRSAAEKGKLAIVVLITLGTIVMWMTQSLHHVHPTVVVFFAITLLTLTGVLTAVSLKSVPWDVLILMAGGLALGKGISESGLADFFSAQLPQGMSAMTLGLVFAFVAVLASNFMSNTAAANAIIPLIFTTVSAADSLMVVVPATLACSCATLLPVSTPPNAICYATGKLKAADFFRIGLLMIVLGPIVSYAWMTVVL